MLSWASYLFGSGTTEPQSEETSQEPKASQEPETMETSDSPAKPEPEQDWVVVDYAGVYFTISLTLVIFCQSFNILSQYLRIILERQPGISVVY